MPFATSRGTRLHWRRVPEDADPGITPVLLIMGLGGSSRAWWRLLPHLGPVPAILFDHRGTGRSDSIHRPFGISTLVDDALAVLDAAGAARAHVVGVSLGGFVAQNLALEHRGRVASLVLASTAAGGGLMLKPPWRLLAATALRPLLGSERTWNLLVPAFYSARSRLDALRLLAPAAS